MSVATVQILVVMGLAYLFLQPVHTLMLPAILHSVNELEGLQSASVMVVGAKR